MTLEDRCAAQFAVDHPGETGRRLDQLPSDTAAGFLVMLGPEHAAAVLGHMQSTAAASCLATMPTEVAAPLLALQTLDQAARIIRLMPEAAAVRILESTDPKRRIRLQRTLAYPALTGGAMMDPSAVTIPQGASVADAVRELRRRPVGIYSYVYVVDTDERVVGVLGVRELLAGDPKARIGDVMRHDPVRVSPYTDLATIAALPAWQEMDAIPVMDREGRLLGAIRHRTVRRLLAPNANTVRFDQLGATLTQIGEIYWSTLGVVVAAAAGVVAQPTHPTPAEAT